LLSAIASLVATALAAPQENQLIVLNLIQAISFCKKVEKASFLTINRDFLSPAWRLGLPACHRG
jgi:hypothetical protein